MMNFSPTVNEKLIDGCILWGTRVFVPPQGRKSVLQELHDTHLGASK